MNFNIQSGKTERERETRFDVKMTRSSIRAMQNFSFLFSCDNTNKRLCTSILEEDVPLSVSPSSTRLWLVSNSPRRASIGLRRSVYALALS